MNKYDIIIIGAGASGLSAARMATKNNRHVLVLDSGDVPARKVFVSGGGRCNFTNAAAQRDRYFGENPDFVRSAIAQVKPNDILNWMRSHNLSFFEKSPGQFFCKTQSSDIINAMIEDIAPAEIILNTTVLDIEKSNNEFIITTNNSSFYSKSVIIATGGVSYSSLGVSDIGYKIAKKFGHKIIPIEPALVGLKTNLFPSELSGISLNVSVKIGKKIVSDSLLFTHFGIGGPAALRTSMFDLKTDIHINFLPDVDVYDFLISAKKTDGKKLLPTLLSYYLPQKFARWISNNSNHNIADFRDAEIKQIATYINDFPIHSGELKRRDLDSAEVVKGGVSTEFISSKTMESKLSSGLFFAGEVLDIAGDLGGFNMHFAFASGIVAGKSANDFLSD